jgi:tetratricopeptide (TPR) repeat protein
LLVPFAGFFFYMKYWSNTRIRKTFFMQLVVWPIYLFTGFQFVSNLATSLAPGLSMLQPGSSEESPSSFPSDSNASPSSEEQFPASDPSPQISETPTSAEPNFGTVGGQQYDFNQSMQLGKLAYKKGDYQTALINFNRAVQANPGDAEALKGFEDTKKAIAQAKTK